MIYSLMFVNIQSRGVNAMSFGDKVWGFSQPPAIVVQLVKPSHTQETACQKVSYTKVHHMVHACAVCTLPKDLRWSLDRELP